MYSVVNGLPVIEGRPVSDHRREALVICDRGIARIGSHRFVVWRVFTDEDWRVSASAGYYTDDYRDAQSNMDAR